jgi:hypothetical protein
MNCGLSSFPQIVFFDNTNVWGKGGSHQSESKSMNTYYQNFLKSSRWLELKKEYRRNGKAYKCRVCGKGDGNKQNPLNLHHTSYKHGLLNKNFIVVLCQKHHHLLHFISGQHSTKNIGHKDIDVIKAKMKKLSIRRLQKLEIRIPIDVYEAGRMREWVLLELKGNV